MIAINNRAFGLRNCRRLAVTAAALAALALPTPTHAAKVPGNPAAGKPLFLANNCSSCHTLKAARASGAISSNLDKKKASYTTILRVITNGTTKNGLAMPSYKGSLTVKQIQNLAAFVYTSTHT